MKNILYHPFICRIGQTYFGDIYRRDVLVIHELVGNKRIEPTDSAEIKLAACRLQR